MTRLSVISFTENGMRLSEEISQAIEQRRHADRQKEADRNTVDEEQAAIEVTLYTKCRYGIKDAGDTEKAHSLPILFVTESLTEWVEKRMQEKNALLFIGACGIAVRAIAPFLTDKLTDVPVLVMDEIGKHVIPVLSGHMGGANELAYDLAKVTGAEPVITTATDLNEKFAVDLFAKKNSLFIRNKDGIAKVSAKVLAGKEITVAIEPEHVDVCIASKTDGMDALLWLSPREYIIGMGCKKGKAEKEIGDFITRKLEQLGISESQIYALSSISQKREEAGLVEWCRKRGIRFLTYTAEELWEVEGTFQKSAFVEAQVGVDNVCERAALKACGPGGILICEKCAEDGMTFAAAKRRWTVTF